jgi:hypothetical protein
VEDPVTSAVKLIGGVVLWPTMVLESIGSAACVAFRFATLKAAICGPKETGTRLLVYHRQAAAQRRGIDVNPGGSANTVRIHTVDRAALIGATMKTVARRQPQ